MKDNKTSATGKKAPNDLLTVLELEFDSEFYLDRYPDISKSGVEPLEHYAFSGWLLGRDPCLAFSTSFYLSRYKDVAEAGMNPFYHYLKFGRKGGRWPMDPIAGNIDRDRLKDILREFFDADFYLQQYPDIKEAGFDALEHYVTSGFSEGRIPFPGFEPREYLADHGLSDDDSPLYHYAIFGSFLHERKAESGPLGSNTHTRETEKTREIIATITPEFDVDYYLNVYRDVAKSGMEPVRHFVIHGWKEGRNPHPKFDTKYYLEANPDVKSAGTNPFWHYIVKGKAENRRPVPAGGYKRATLGSLESIDERVKSWSRVQPEDIKTAEQISEGFNRVLIAGSSALVVSLGHDDYKEVVGGVQLCIAEEQELLNAESINYLNISPAIPLPVLASASPDRHAVKLILNGAFVGVIYFDVFLTVLKQLFAVNEWNKYLVIHALHGHTIEGVIALAGMLSPELSYYWLHDYFSICPGYNLLRNDVDYCHAPESSSPACGICVYGEARNVHLTELERLFREIEFDVISPSRIALDLWEEKTSLPYRGKKVITHRELIPGSCGEGDVEVCLDRPLRVAYLGYPITHKGWPVFEDLAVTYEDDDRYDFYHLGIDQKYNKSIDFYEVRTTRENPDLMTEVLRENEINVVVMTSIWPETFSLTTFETISAGCYVLTSVDSGNIAAMVQEKNCGMIYENEQALHAWFEDGSIVDHARSYRSGGPCFQLKKSGITAPLIPEMGTSE